jgi:hypothetical protein
MNVLALAVLLMVNEPAAATETAGENEKLVCKRIDQEATGSRLSGRRKVCMTASEWRLAEEQSRRTLRAIRDRSGVNPNEAGGR